MPRLKTLLSRLRSADADLADPRHDLACRYIAQAAIAEKLVRRFLPPAKLQAEELDLLRGEWRGTIHCEFVGLSEPVRNSLLRKETGRFDTPIGYVDVILPYTYETRRVGESRKSRLSGGSQEWERDPLAEGYPIRRRLVVEVKVQPVPMGEIVRQVTLYREHLKMEEWVVATVFSVTTPDLAELSAAKITHVRLGKPFEKWALAQSQLQPDLSSDEI